MDANTLPGSPALRREASKADHWREGNRRVALKRPFEGYLRLSSSLICAASSFLRETTPILRMGSLPITEGLPEVECFRMIGGSSNAVGDWIDKLERHRLSFLNFNKLNREVGVPPKLYEAVFFYIL